MRGFRTRRAFGRALGRARVGFRPPAEGFADVAAALRQYAKGRPEELHDFRKSNKPGSWKAVSEGEKR